MVDLTRSCSFRAEERVNPTGDDPLNEVYTFMAGRPEFKST